MAVFPSAAASCEAGQAKQPAPPTPAGTAKLPNAAYPAGVSLDILGWYVGRPHACAG